jgi:hypothetical protein
MYTTTTVYFRLSGHRCPHGQVTGIADYRSQGKPSAMCSPPDSPQTSISPVPFHGPSDERSVIFEFDMKRDLNNGLETHDSPNRQCIVLSPTSSSTFAEGLPLLR